jgi:hypothetical protein
MLALVDPGEAALTAYFTTATLRNSSRAGKPVNE